MIDAYRLSELPRDRALKVKLGPTRPTTCAIAGCPVDEDDLGCTHCNGEGICYDGADPLGSCPDDIHDCHACYGSGKRKDQWLF
jgi:hypothetical protein